MSEVGQAIISMSEVRKSYGSKTVIHSLTLDVLEGEFLTILGESGCGKSTLLKMVNGLIAPESGTITVAGRKVASPPLGEAELVVLRRSIGYAVQGSVLFPHLSVSQNIGFVPSLAGKGKAEVDSAICRAAEIAGVAEELLGRMPAQLSGGQAQRVGIARAIAGRPTILLMDEPFGAVDEITRRSLQEQISRIVRQEGLTCLFVTHDISEALKLGTRVLVMREGALEQCDTPDEVVNNPATAYVRRLINPASVD